MDRLILFRHAKAEAHSESGEDLHRRLSPRGVAAASDMGARLAAAGVRPDVALVSPAVRTRETWEGAAAAFPPGQVRYADELYNASPEVVWRTAAGEAGTVVVVGHNPGLHELALALMLAGASPVRAVAEVRRRFPPGTAVVFGIGPDGRASLEGLYFPERGA